MKILVVDNNRLILEFMTDFLTEKGHEVRTAVDGLSALDVLEGLQPQVIFVDLIMPNIDGKKLCQIIRSMPALKDSYVAVLSAIAAEDQIELTTLGADVYIGKGPLPEMSRNVMTVVEAAEQKQRSLIQDRIMGERRVAREVTRELLSVKGHLEIILESMSEGILEVTAEQRIVYVNPAAVSLFGIPEEKLLGMSFTDLFGPTERATMEGLLEKMYSWSLTIADESPLCLNGRLVSMSTAPFYDGQHKAIIILNDVTERKKAEEDLHLAKSAAELANEELEQANEQLEKLNKELQKLTLIDGLTGIGNRRHFDRVLEKEWRRCQRTQDPISLILADIDYFKDYNDRYGHLMGDDCLRKVARQVESCARRPGDLAARYGGEELALVLAGTPLEQAVGLAERARKEILALKIPHESSSVCEFVTVSLGVGTIVPDNESSPQRLIATVDRALYKAKQTGRNRTMVVSQPGSNAPQVDKSRGATA